MNRNDGTARFAASVPDTITSWIISAFAMDSITGFGISPVPAKVNEKSIAKSFLCCLSLRKFSKKSFSQYEKVLSVSLRRLSKQDFFQWENTFIQLSLSTTFFPTSFLSSFLKFFNFLVPLGDCFPTILHPSCTSLLGDSRRINCNYHCGIQLPKQRNASRGSTWEQEGRVWVYNCIGWDKHDWRE